MFYLLRVSPAYRAGAWFASHIINFVAMRAILPLIIAVLLVNPCFRALPVYRIETLAGKFLLPVAHIQKILPGIAFVGKLRHIADLIREFQKGFLILEDKALPVIFPVYNCLCLVRFRRIASDLQILLAHSKSLAFKM
jgi:hypothetical protein